MRVTVDGIVDSIVITGIGDSAYVKKVRQAFLTLGFDPARYRGCPVVGWYRMTITHANR
jgi:hypothetical protein